MLSSDLEWRIIGDFVKDSTSELGTVEEFRRKVGSVHEPLCELAWVIHHCFGVVVIKLILDLWQDDEGQDIAEYAVMLDVILVLVVGTIRLISTNTNTVFSTAASAVQ